MELTAADIRKAVAHLRLIDKEFQKRFKRNGKYLMSQHGELLPWSEADPEAIRRGRKLVRMARKRAGTAGSAAESQ